MKRRVRGVEVAAVWVWFRFGCRFGGGGGLVWVSVWWIEEDEEEKREGEREIVICDREGSRIQIFRFLFVCLFF